MAQNRSPAPLAMIRRNSSARPTTSTFIGGSANGTSRYSVASATIESVSTAVIGYGFCNATPTHLGMFTTIGVFALSGPSHRAQVRGADAPARNDWYFASDLTGSMIGSVTTPM